jgi:hypothetical protein
MTRNRQSNAPRATSCLWLGELCTSDITGGLRKDLNVIIHALGWRTARERRYLPLQDDIASVAYWYQTLPSAPFPPSPDKDYLEVI